MSQKPKIYKYNNQKKVVTRLRDDFNNEDRDFILLYAYNGTGKTRLSMEFKEIVKRKKGQEKDTLYFNAFTEDLFHWDNDLYENTNRELILNKDSKFFPDIKALGIEDKIRVFLHRYCDFDFSININTKEDKDSGQEYEYWAVNFRREVIINGRSEIVNNIKVSRGEENIFIWCFFLAIAQLAIDEHEDYKWVKYFYIDDPISSLDDNNVIAVASDLAYLLKQEKTLGAGDALVEVAEQQAQVGNMITRQEKIKTIISSHHSLFFNVMCNEVIKYKHKKYFLYSNKDTNEYTLQATDDTPFFHHVAMLHDLQKAVKSQILYAYHFNILRNVLEKTSTFFGYKDFSECIKGIEDEKLFERALDLLSHGNYSIYEPKRMVSDSQKLFKKILEAFLNRYKFDLPELN